MTKLRQKLKPKKLKKEIQFAVVVNLFTNQTNLNSTKCNWKKKYERDSEKNVVTFIANILSTSSTQFKYLITIDYCYSY